MAGKTDEWRMKEALYETWHALYLIGCLLQELKPNDSRISGDASGEPDGYWGRVKRIHDLAEGIRVKGAERIEAMREAMPPVQEGEG